jgi:ribosomal protein L12E/L44/L45/RPP1/RPP2
MGMRTFLEDFRDLRRSVRELMATETEAEEAASNVIVTSASRFSRRSRRVVNDKLSFSATLMRAGEVDAANRLLDEVEREVRTEEAALIETVNEVKIAHTARRDRITRLRLARTLAAATLGAGLLTMSAAGMAVASFLQDRAEATRVARVAGSAQRFSAAKGSRIDSAKPKMKMKRLHVGNVRLVLTAAELEQLEEVAGGDVEESNLQTLISLLSGNLAQKVHDAIVAASGTVDKAVATVEQTALVQQTQRKARKAAKSTDETNAGKKDQPEEPAPEPSGSPDSGSSDGGGGDGGPQNESGDIPLPESDISSP